MTISKKPFRHRRVLVGGTAAIAAVAACAALMTGPGPLAGAKAPGRTTVVLGSTATRPIPNCPAGCRGIVSSTGFQTSNEQGRLPFTVPFDGTVTAWTLSLGQPTNAQRSYFNNTFGRPSEAHLAILRRVPKTKPPKYRLRRQSRIRVLSPFFGRTVRFKLGSQLRVLKGDIVALSVPTWAPAFADGLDATSRWRASRAPNRCGAGAAADGRPQQVVKSTRVYGCDYSTARLLYTATVVKSRAR